MSLHLVLLSVLLGVSLANTEQCASSLGSSIDLFLHSHKNESGHWIVKVDTRRSTLTEDQAKLTVHVHQETRLCGNNETEQLISMTSVLPSLYDSSMPTALSPASTTATPFTTTPTETTPKSCPRSGYQLFPGFNCYKVFPLDGEIQTWSDAREVCRRDGGDLLVMETERERKDVFSTLYNSVRFSGNPWMGVYIPQGGESWISVTGEPVPSSWWAPGYPVDDVPARKCAPADGTGLLWNVICASTRPFICEIPL